MVRSRKGPAMNDYMITTDNNADLPEDFYKNHEVGCTYLSYTLEGKEYTEETRSNENAARSYSRSFVVSFLLKSCIIFSNVDAIYAPSSPLSFAEKIILFFCAKTNGMSH